MIGDILSLLLLSIVLSIPVGYLLVTLFKKYVERKINSNQEFEIEASSIPFVQNVKPIPEFKFLKPNGKQKNVHDNLTPLLISLIISAITINFSSYLVEGRAIKPLSFLLFLYYTCLPIFYFYYLHNIHSSKRRNLILIIACLTFLFATLLTVIVKHLPLLDTFLSVIYLYGYMVVLMILTSIFRRIRQVVFALLPPLFISLTCLLFVVRLFSNDTQALSIIFNPLYKLLDYFGNRSQTHIVFSLLLVLSFIAIALFILGIFRKMYLAKVYNNFLLIVDIVWFFHMVITIVSYNNSSYVLILCIILFLIFKLIQYFIFKFYTKNRIEGKSLLILRVFSLGKSSDFFFTKVKNWWAFKGSIKLIAGYDLTTSIIDIDDLLTFISGRMKYRFNTTSKFIERNLQQIDNRPDIDGRYRVNEMYCNNSTWKVVLQGIIKNLDYVIMDIRTFSKSNAGCAYEIKTLIWQIDLRKIVFIVNEETKLDFVQKCVSEAWENMPQNSPNLNTDQNFINLFRYETDSDFDKLTESFMW